MWVSCAMFTCRCTWLVHVGPFFLGRCGSWIVHACAAALGRNRTQIHCVFRSCYYMHIPSVVALSWERDGSYVLRGDMYTYE